MITRTVSGRTFSFSHSVGQQSNGGNGFRYPMDLEIAADGSAYVLSTTAEFMPSTRITKCNLGYEAGQEEFLFEFGRYGTDDGQFIRTTSLALDRDENVYVSDEWLNRISIFDKDGNFLRKWGVAGSGDGELSRPWGLAFDRDDNLWIVDSGNSRLQKFTKEGKFLSKWGKKGSGDAEFDMPWGITIDGDGNLYVADWNNRRVQKLSPDGQLLMTFGAPDGSPGELRRPSGVAVDEEGDVYVVDWGGSQVHAFGPDGSYITTFVGDAEQLSKWAQVYIAANPDYQKARKRVKSLEPEWRLFYPTSADIDKKGRLVIADQQRSRLQIYIKEKDYLDPQYNL